MNSKSETYHLLTFFYLFTHVDAKHAHPNDIDKIITAKILDETKEPELFKVITSFMIHRPCGSQNFKSSCMQNENYIIFFPKKISIIALLRP